MSTDQLSSLAESIGSSIPVGGEAVKYNTSSNQRPASSRKLFDSNSRNNSEACPIADEVVLTGENWDEGDHISDSNVRKNQTMTSEKISDCMDKLFSKLSQDMGRVCAIYGDGSLFSQSSLTFDAELIELSKLCEADARDQLERYALRCHINEREKEQLHKRNRELHDAVEILRTQVIQGQCKIISQVRMLAKQAIDSLRSLEQTSSFEITKWKQKHALSLAQSNTLQHQLKHTAMQLQAKKEELKELNKNFDMIRFERDSLRNHNDHLQQQLEEVKSRVGELVKELKMKEDSLQASQEQMASRDKQISGLKEELKNVEVAAEAHLKRREDEITKQMDSYLQETRSIDAERERLVKLKIIEIQHQLELAVHQRESAERRAQVAEEKVADYESNFIHYRGQMEGEAIRAITSGYRKALSTIPSSRREACSSLDKLFPLKSSNYCENLEPPADPCGKALSNSSKQPSRSESVSSRPESYPQRRQK